MNSLIQPPEDELLVYKWEGFGRPYSITGSLSSLESFGKFLFFQNCLKNIYFFLTFFRSCRWFGSQQYIAVFRRPSCTTSQYYFYFLNFIWSWFRRFKQLCPSRLLFNTSSNIYRLMGLKMCSMKKKPNIQLKYGFFKKLSVSPMFWLQENLIWIKEMGNWSEVHS